MGEKGLAPLTGGAGTEPSACQADALLLRHSSSPDIVRNYEPKRTERNPTGFAPPTLLSTSPIMSRGVTKFSSNSKNKVRFNAQMLYSSFVYGNGSKLQMYHLGS